MSIAQIFESGEQASLKGHFRNLVLLSQIDGVLLNEEKSLLKKISERLSLSEDQVKEISKSPNDFHTIPPSSQEERMDRYIQFVELILVDGKIDPKEESMAHRLGVALGIDHSQVEGLFKQISSLLLSGSKRDEILGQIHH